MTLTSVSLSSSSNTSSQSSTTLAGAAAPDAGNGSSAAPSTTSTTPTTSSSASSTSLTSSQPTTTTEQTTLTRATSSSTSLKSSTTLVPVATTAASPPPSLTPPTSFPDPAGTSPDSSSPSDDPGADPDSGADPGADDPGPDDPEPAAQSSAQPNAQSTFPTVSIASSAAPKKSRDPQATKTMDPMTIPISSATVSSIASPLAISIAGPTSTLASSVVPVSSASATGQDPAIAANGSSNGPAGSNKAAVAGGVIGALVGASLLFGLLFLFFRRKFHGGQIRLRRQSIDGPLLSGDGGPRSPSELMGKIAGVIAVLDVRKYIKRRIPSVYEGPSPNPAFSNIGTRTPSPQMSSPRRRSWSAPPPTFRERLQAAAAVFPIRAIPRKPVSKGFIVERRSSSTTESPPQLPPVFQRENGSVSSIARAVYSPEADEYLNPFRDPDPTAPLRIVNSDPSRHGTPSATPMQNDRVAFNPAYQFTPMPTQPQPLHQRPMSQSENPFLDASETIGTAVPFAITPPTTSSGTSSHRRAVSISSLRSNRSSVGPVPQVPALQPSQRGQSHMPQLSNASSNYSTTGDSGFISASPDVSPISPKEPASGLLPMPAPPSALRTPQSMQYQPSPRLQPPMSALRTPQGMAYQPSPAMTGPMSAIRGSKFSFDLNAFGEPGPTRPNTFFNDMATPGANTRMSDPFDLDKPEVLGLMWRDSNGAKRGYGRNSKRKSMSVSNWPMGSTIRPVPE